MIKYRSTIATPTIALNSCVNRVSTGHCKWCLSLTHKSSVPSAYEVGKFPSDETRFTT